MPFLYFNNFTTLLYIVIQEYIDIHAEFLYFTFYSRQAMILKWILNKWDL